MQKCYRLWGQGNLPVISRGSNLVIKLAGPMLSMQSSIRGSGNESETVTAMTKICAETGRTIRFRGE